MKKINGFLFALLLLALAWGEAKAQERQPKPKAYLDLSLQTDMYLAKKQEDGRRFMSNNYLSAQLRYDKLECGLRYEYLKHPLPGFETTNKGQGLANLYLKASLKKLQLTLGSVYGQFGSGMLLRLYEDRALGIDNALLGAKVLYTPIEAIRLKTLAGVQRNHFDYTSNRGVILGADLEYDVHQHLNFLSDKGYILQLGLAYVSKKEQEDKSLLSPDLKYRLKQPEYVGAFSSRLHLLKGNFDLFSEFALKGNDPNQGNNYSFAKGTVGMLNLSYGAKGLSVLLGARRSENFDFRSVRSATNIDYRINHLLPFTQQRSFALASLYPYATQSKGEWAFQGEVRYRLKRRTWYGGRYGTELRLTASHVRGLKAKNAQEQSLLQMGSPTLIGTDGVASSFFGMGEQYFHDYGFELSRKINKHYRFSLLYSNQAYNQEVLEGHSGGDKLIKSHIFIYEGKHKLSRRVGLRTELQYSHSKQALGDWLYAGLELSLSPHFIFSMSDQYNIDGKHYPMFALTTTYGMSRLQLSYGKTRAGINCSGGVCRYMPETEGFFLSYTLTP